MSTKLTFKLESTEKDHSLTLYDMQESTWPDLLEIFVSFLRGEGYMIEPGGYVEDVELIKQSIREQQPTTFWAGVDDDK